MARLKLEDTMTDAVMKMAEGIPDFRKAPELVDQEAQEAR